MNSEARRGATSTGPHCVCLESSIFGRDPCPEADCGPKINALVRWAFYAFVVTIPFESVDLFRSDEGSLTVSKVLGLVFAGIALTQLRACFAKPLLAFWLFVAYFAVTLILGVSGDREYWSAVSAYLLTLMQNLILFWISINVLRDRRAITGMLLAAGISCSVLSILMSLGIATREIATADGKRLSFADADPNSLALVLIIGLFSLVGLAYVRNQPLRWKVLLLSFCVPLVQMIALAGSRAAVASLGVGTGTILIQRCGRGKAKPMLFLSALFALMAWQVLRSEILMSRWEREFAEGGLGHRQSITLSALSMVADKPILGWGPFSHLTELSNREGYNLPFRDPHNDLLWAFTSTGILGGIPFMFAMWSCLHNAWKSRKGCEDILPLALMLVICVTSLSITLHKRKIVWISMAYAVSSGGAVAFPSRSTAINRRT